MENNEKPLIKGSLGEVLGTVSENKEKIDKIIKKQSTGLPKAPIEFRIKDAIEHPKQYSLDDLEQLWIEYHENLEQLKMNAIEDKAKTKLLKSFEKAVDNEYSTDWTTPFKIFGLKIKTIFKKGVDDVFQKEKKKQ